MCSSLGSCLILTNDVFSPIDIEELAFDDNVEGIGIDEEVMASTALEIHEDPLDMREEDEDSS